MFWLTNRPTEEEKERIRQILGDWISDSEGEDVNKIRRNEEFINYLVDVKGTRKEKSEQRSKSKMKTVIKKIIRDKQIRAKRIDSEKKNKIKYN